MTFVTHARWSGVGDLLLTALLRAQPPAAPAACRGYTPPADRPLALAELASTPAESDSVRLYALTALAGQAYPYAAYPTAMSFVQRARRDAAVGGFTHSRGMGAAGDWPAPARRVVADRLVALRAGDPSQDVRAAAGFVTRHMALDSLMRTPEAQRYKPKP